MDFSTFTHKPSVAVHKFSSCDGCQLAFLNAGVDLLTLYELVEIVHFVEAGDLNPQAKVDIAFVEGSISTAEEQIRIKEVRANSKFLITIGACATAGGLQALRNTHNIQQWTSGVYAQPAYIESLATATPIANHVRVDFELWGCPVSSRQVFTALRSLLSGVMPTQEREKVCLECKRLNNVCVLVAKGLPCMGPVTNTGCGAICPKVDRECYACYGPAENINASALIQQLIHLGYPPSTIAQRFWFINNAAPAFTEAGKQAQELEI